MSLLKAKISILFFSTFACSILPVIVTAQTITYTPSVAIPGQPAIESQFLGSVPAGKPTGSVLHLSLKEALEKGLRQNLGMLVQEESVRAERGKKWKELSSLLPNLVTKTSANIERDNLAAKGLTLPGLPQMIGPYGYYDARVFLTQTVFDLNALDRTRAADKSLEAAVHSYGDARELVVAAVGNAYLQALAGESRVETARAQLDTAQTLFENAVQMHRAGVTPGIDELRARVELQTRRQQLIAAGNEFEKQKLIIARIIGLPTGQDLELTDKAPYSVVGAISVEQGLERAYQSRQDLKSATARVTAAELSLDAATAKYYPSLAVEANYGALGTDPGKLKDTYTVSGVLSIPLFQGGSVRGEELQAEAALRRSRDELADLQAQIEYEIRTALLDLKAGAEQVDVARSSVELAELTLSQARERFAAGVSDNLEVVQAQESVAAAHEAYISGLYAHNLAKLELARALGVAEKRVEDYLGGK
ncbi:MAG TPA: TolC family protein [Geobacteraceae bacterium]|nr:TolC family protein [Geobacteraceae bacterium]